VLAQRFITIDKIETIRELLSFEKDLFLIGGGSNMLLLNDIKRLVVHIAIKGKKIIKKDKRYIYIEVAAGENWHDFVMWCIDNGYGGVENLALIPGNVGTSPIQNIGAYGVEVKDVIQSVKAIEISTGKEVVFSNDDCKFNYRDSIFKNTHKGKFIITSVIFGLTHTKHSINDSYGAIKAITADDKSIKNIAEAVIAIRTEKLPDPKEIGNSGSFFKNPMVSKEKFRLLQQENPSIPNYPILSNPNLVKLAAGWLIDQCGLKGYRKGDAGVHKNQALVLVNYGNATGKEILELAKFVQTTVKKKFDVLLDMEVNIIES
jgi:UDP-N-acetylmuramate dehydrogenase